MPRLSVIRSLPIIFALGLKLAAAADFPNAFHVAGLSGLKEEGRVDITLAPGALEFNHAKYSFSIPYSRISNVQIYMAERHYEKTSEAAKFAGVYGVPASVLILMIKKQADVVVFDYTNPHGGVEGAVLHVERGQGLIFGDLLKSHGVQVTFPPVDKTGNSKP